MPGEEHEPYPWEVRVSPLDAVTIEIAWCPACQVDCTVEITALEGDPCPVAVCVDCGSGMETWWEPELIEVSHRCIKAS